MFGRIDRATHAGMSAVLLGLVLSGLLAGCGVVRTESSADGREPTADAAPASFFYQFEDVQVPAEMKLKDAETYIIQTGNVKSGVQTFYGRVETFSLVDWFKATMPRDGWALRSSLASKRSILVFEKPEKDCVIHISPDMYDTRLEVWMTPRNAGGGMAPAAMGPMGGGTSRPIGGGMGNGMPPRSGMGPGERPLTQ